MMQLDLMIPMLGCMQEADLADLVASVEVEVEAVLESILKTYSIWALVEDLEELVEGREAGREVDKVKEQLIHFLLVEVVQEATDSKCEDRL
jgi:hypothetical protein